MKCAVKNCACFYYKNKPTNVAFHQFPKTFAGRRKWMTILKPYVGAVNYDADRICSYHFDDSCFRFIGGKKWLNDDAIPSKFSNKELIKDFSSFPSVSSLLPAKFAMEATEVVQQGGEMFVLPYDAEEAGLSKFIIEAEHPAEQSKTGIPTVSDFEDFFIKQEADIEIEDEIVSEQCSSAWMPKPNSQSNSASSQQQQQEKYESDDSYETSRPDTENKRPPDEYSAFGDVISCKIRKLRTEKLRNIAQHKIMNILFELEISEENIM